MGTEEQFQAIVIGAGPAGSTAARELALQGHRVLLLEKASFPRDKPCGGGLGPKTMAQLPFSIEDIPHLRMERIAYGLRGRAQTISELPESIHFFMAERTDFDQRLAQAAVDAGAQLMTGEAVRSLGRLSVGFEIHTSNGVYRSRYLIGADGARSIVRRLVDISARRKHAVALKCDIKVSESLLSKYVATPLFDFEPAAEGYGWIFPRPTHLNVGVVSMKHRHPPLRPWLDEFILRYQLASPSMLTTLSVHSLPIPLGTSGEPARAGNTLLVGDAAGVADGFSAEGICYAMASGELAADLVSRSLAGEPHALEEYESELDQRVKRDYGPGAFMSRIARVFPDAACLAREGSGDDESGVAPAGLDKAAPGESPRVLPDRLVSEYSTNN